MSGCKFPEHHKSGSKGSSWLVVVALVLAAVIWHKIRTVGAYFAGVMYHVVTYLVVVAVVLAAAAVAAVVIRLVHRQRRLADPGHPIRVRLARTVRARQVHHGRWRHLPAAARASFTWHWLMGALAVAGPPRALIYPDAHGIVARVRTVPKAGRSEFEKHAEHIANHWRCHRVQVHQVRPGRLVVRGLRRDPLNQPLPMSAAPPGVYGNRQWPADLGPEIQHGLPDLRLYVGRDEWGADRWLPLPGVTGITVGGLPGFGKTSAINSWLMQLAGLPVQFVFIDGKGGGDYSDWQDRAWIYTGDDLEAAADALEDVHALMRRRLAQLEEARPRNRWHVGLTVGWPLIVTVIDECHTFFDLDAVKGQREAEARVRACRTLAGQLVKKGRSPLFVTVFATQKQTSDAIPTAIRDNCGAGVSFAVKTRDAAVAALGEQIREYPSYCPTTLQDPAYIGVMTASLRTGADPFVRIRVPEVTEDAAAARAAETASLRSDPRALVPSPGPAADNEPAGVLVTS